MVDLEGDVVFEDVFEVDVLIEYAVDFEEEGVIDVVDLVGEVVFEDVFTVDVIIECIKEEVVFEDVFDVVLVV